MERSEGRGETEKRPVHFFRSGSEIVRGRARRFFSSIQQHGMAPWSGNVSRYFFSTKWRGASEGACANLLNGLLGAPDCGAWLRTLHGCATSDDAGILLRVRAGRQENYCAVVVLSSRLRALQPGIVRPPPGRSFSLSGGSR